MKKLIILLFTSLSVILSFAQNQIDWMNLNSIKYPISIDSKGVDENGDASVNTIEIKDANQLLWHCISTADKYISSARTCFIWGTSLILGGGVMLSLDPKDYDSSNLSIIGSILLTAGGIFDIIAINNTFQYAKWSHRERIVQLSLSPTKVSLSF